MKTRIACILLVACGAFASPQEDVTKARAASDARPQHPTLLYRLAQALEANGQRAEAVSVLERVASMGLTYPAEKDFPHESFAAATRRFAQNAKPVGTARHELTIERLGLIPEGMAFDGKRLFVSSVRMKTIYAGDQVFATAPWGVFGMAVDRKRGVLWATTTALPQVEDFRPEDKGKSALLKISLRDGRTLATLPAPEGEHHFGDVAVASDGAVYVSDSASPAIYRVEAEQLVPFVKGPFRSLQGLAIAGEKLYVADYSHGLFAIDRRTLDVIPLRVPENVTTLGIDGLNVVDERTLVATQNGTIPNRIIRIRLTPGGLAVASVDTLAANLDGMGDPTLGVVANGRFFFNANGQWDLFSEDGKISDPLRLREAVVLSVTVR